MICENCGKNNATTYFRQNINGKVTETFLCSECAKKKGLTGMSVSDFFSPFSFGMTKADTKRCECGTVFEEIAQTGMVGCPKCYTTFKNELASSLRKIHGAKKHIGRLPFLAKKEESKDDASSLKKELEKAIKEERFEDAATIRDRIKEIEGK